jgi:lysophospholipase L1-like esterase
MDKAGIIAASGTLASLSFNQLGVLAFGDSITNGGGELQWGVALQSWALWVARALGLPFTNYAADGDCVADVLERQIPAFESRTAYPKSGYDLGCLYIGVNDVRGFGWDPVCFEERYGRALAFIAARCERTLAVTAPLDLGRPRAGAKVRDLNAIIARVAREHGALLLDLAEFSGRNLLMADHVHPTAFGQIAIAERALAVLEADGLEVRARPSEMISYEISWFGRLRSDTTFVYRRTKEALRAGRFYVTNALRGS